MANMSVAASQGSEETHDHNHQLLSSQLHEECRYQCRSVVISQYINLYPPALAQVDEIGFLPLHRLLTNESSSIDDALMMIEKYPVALQHYVIFEDERIYALHIEIFYQCRVIILSKCIELYPEALNKRAINSIMFNINGNNFDVFASVLSMIFIARPTSLYWYDKEDDVDEDDTVIEYDIRDDPYYRRRILDNLLPHHVFTPTHESDYRDLNWQPRAAMIMLLSQMKIQQCNSTVNVEL
jgi:hypothetical protein